jgi:hypothetical protein
LIFPRCSRLPKIFAITLIASVLLAEYALIEHAVEHSFVDTDEVCFVCEKADNFQNSLSASTGSVQLAPKIGFSAQVLFSSRICSFPGFFLSRGPPASYSSVSIKSALR